MSEVIRLIKDFVRGQLSCDESLSLLDEIIESEEWIQHLEIDMLLYDIARKKREM